MNPRNHSMKLFLITAIFLSLLVGGLLLFQTQYFSSYYVKQKEREFTTNVKAIIEQLDGSRLSETQIISEFELYRNNNGVMPVLYPLYPAEHSIIDPFKSYLFESIGIPKNSETGSIAPIVLQEALDSKEIPKEPIYLTLKPKGFDQTYLTARSLISIGKSPYILVIIISLQPVDEAISLLNSSFWLVLAITILLSILLATLISRLIARPLIREIEREQELDTMRREFIANASHELKTPISIISGYAESLEDGVVVGEERKMYERVIHDEAQKMGKLVRDMLDIAILQKNTNTSSMAPTMLDQLLVSTLERFSMHIRKRNIKLHLDGFSPTTVTVDVKQIGTVADNLISNAIYHTTDGGFLKVRLVHIGHMVRVEIENQGDPILEEHKERIWDAFYRVDAARNREDGRYGLGLSIVRGIMHKHSGYCGAYNTDDGVCFTFELPLFQRADDTIVSAFYIT
jgi:signal transduction histidine kinase